MIERFDIQTADRNQIIDITEKVAGAVTRARIMSGICLVYTPHTTSAIAINENADPTVKSDMLRKLAAVFPEHDDFQHLEGNSDAHIKSSLIGCSATIPIENGKLLLGTWQGIFFCEFDGRRHREFYVKITEG